MNWLQRFWLLLTSCCHVVIAPQPCPTVVNNRYSQAGKDLFDAGKYLEAIECLEMAVEKAAAVPQSYTNLAAAQMEAKLYEDCERNCMKALKINRRYVPAFEALSALCQRQGRHIDALTYDHKAFKYSLTNVQSLVRMAEDLQKLGRYSRSMLYLDKALQIDSKLLAAKTRKAIAFFEESQFVKSANLAHELLESNPSDNQQEGTAQRILLASLLKTGRSDLAVVHSSRWLSTTASTHDVNCALMNIQRLINAFDREEYHKVGVQLLFSYLLEKSVTLPSGFHYICSPQMFFYLPATQEQRTTIAKYVSASYPKVLESSRQSYQRLFEKFPEKYKHLNGSRLRVGIIGSCFHEKSALALFLLRIVTKFLDNSDRVLDIYLYAVNQQRDVLTDMFISMVEGRFRNESGFDAEHIAHHIFEDNIHVLVDVAGFSNSLIQRTLAMKPAPVQIGYLAFPGTSGSDYMDYVICDPIACEKDDDFTELLINLPHTVIPPIREVNDVDPGNDNALSREKMGIAPGNFVFCSLSLSSYIDRATIKLWTSILQKTPNSVLWIVLFSNSSELAMLAEAEKLGIKQRLRLTLDLAYTQMKRYAPGICDLYLDTPLYNDYLRVAMALNFGIPVLTVRGGSMATGLTTSMLFSAGVERELAAPNKQKYIEGAMYYYTWPNRLKQLRQKLADHKKNRDVPLFNAQVHYITLTHAFVRAHEKYARGKKRKFYIEVPGHEDYNTNKRHINITYKGT